MIRASVSLDADVPAAVNRSTPLATGVASRSSSTSSSLLYAPDEAIEAVSPTFSAHSSSLQLLDRYVCCKQLRRTLYGETALYRDHDLGGKMIVLKRLSISALQEDADRSHENPLREHAVIRLLDAYDRSNVAKPRPGRAHVVNYEREALFTEGDDVFVAMEFCAGGDLYEYLTLQPGRKLDEREALRLTSQMALGLQFLHRCLGVAHRDLSLENVLLSASSDRGVTAKLCDFGLSMDAGAVSSEAVGKFYYMAPEVAECLGNVCENEDGYDGKAADVWSLGVMLFIMLTGSPLFADERTRAPTMRVLAKYGVTKVFELWGNLQRRYSRRTVNLLACMLQVRPEHRLTIDEVVRHPALRGVM
jgi:calcium-dependent protein kinase